MIFRISAIRMLIFALMSLTLISAHTAKETLGSVKSIKNDRAKAPNEDQCPPCFNCMLPMFECKQFSECNSFNGRCECIDGFGGDDCSKPLCGALSDGNSKRPIRGNETQSCDCETGWSGINCNVCQEDSVCDAFMPEGLKGTCYKNGMIVKEFHQACDVTNQKIVEILKGSKPQVTFSCNKTSAECNFQFWIDEMESFYCGLDTCAFEFDLEKNASNYKCNNVKCKCVPGEMLCGQRGSIDISDFLTETIRGPGEFSCDLETRSCRFKEPSMNDLILTVFGDPYITLTCDSGECIHYTEIPGFEIPGKDKLSIVSISILLLSSAAVICLASLAVFAISKSPLFNNGPISLPDNDSDEFDLYKANASVALTFENIDYQISSSKDATAYVLNQISGSVKTGEILAIMGGSGAGKTTLLDILAMKNKTGHVSGSIKINGLNINRENYSKIVGFVDQEDYLLPTLTVYETVLNSALLRLPKKMSLAAKQRRVYDVLEELRIFDIKDRVIGNEFERGISGGEKRRVSIACELVTSPQVLFLDEPTSGLDANNANNVVECLVRLATHYNKTLVLSIHQPRSSIFQLFDKLVLLSHGEMVYSGEAKKVSEFLRSEGYVCPPDYNIADYLIDVTFEPNKFAISVNDENDLEASLPGERVVNPVHNLDPTRKSITGGTTQTEWEHLAVHRDEFRDLLAHTEADGDAVGSFNTHILHILFKNGSHYQKMKFDINEILSSGNEETIAIPQAYNSASFLQQLSILSSRTFKNVYRNPKLLLGNFVLTLLLGLFLGSLYYNVENDISGFQNRLGLFFFILTYFGFLTFTGLSSFSLERIIFIKERSNNYYSPLAYFMSKILSDVLPLRVLPPFILALVVYPMVGLNMNQNAFFKFVGILILFNLAISLEILTIGILFKDLNNSIIVSVLIILGSLLFSGLFINTKDISNVAFKYLKNFSVFYYAYESLIINEVKTLILREKKYGLNIEVPGATILSTFGFLVQNLLFDIKILVVFNIVFLVLGYFALKWIVVEQR